MHTRTRTRTRTHTHAAHTYTYTCAHAPLAFCWPLQVVSKLFNTHHVWHGDTSRPEEGLSKTLRDLQLEHLDLYLMHWPVAIEQTDLKPLGGLRLADGTPNPKLVLEMEYMDTWREMLRFKKDGRVRGVAPARARVFAPRSRGTQLQSPTQLAPSLARTGQASRCVQLHGRAATRADCRVP